MALWGISIAPFAYFALVGFTPALFSINNRSRLRLLPLFPIPLWVNGGLVEPDLELLILGLDPGSRDNGSRAKTRTGTKSETYTPS